MSRPGPFAPSAMTWRHCATLQILADEGPGDFSGPKRARRRPTEELLAWNLASGSLRHLAVTDLGLAVLNGDPFRKAILEHRATRPVLGINHDGSVSCLGREPRQQAGRGPHL